MNASARPAPTARAGCDGGDAGSSTVPSHLCVRCIRCVLNAPVEVMIDQVRSHQLMTALPVLAACAPSAVAERSPIPTLQLTVTRLSGTTRPFPQIDQHRVAASHGNLCRGIVDPLYGEHRLSNNALVFATMGAAHT